MNDHTTCLVCIRDIVISNIHNDPYLLVQVSEYKKSVYENQLNRDIHFKMIRTNKDQSVSYYKNTDPETMIRIRDTDRVTFNIIRPNGKLLFSYSNDIVDVKIVSEADRKAYLENTVVITNPEEQNIELIQTNVANITEGDTLTLFDNEVEKGDETRVLYVDKKESKVLLEYVESKTHTSYKRALINKFQISISLEII